MHYFRDEETEASAFCSSHDWFVYVCAAVRLPQLDLNSLVKPRLQLFVQLSVLQKNQL